jgi:aspartyl-tRNA(Asn)/glutamyl-tRNA(Gln) amidotransferase subunit C
MDINEDDVIHISSLCRIGLSKKELAKLSSQLSDILANFDVLKKVDTTNVIPTGHTANVQNVMRDDKKSPSAEKSEVLSNAPQTEDGLFRVIHVLDEP